MEGAVDREMQARNAEQAAIVALPFDEVTIRQKSAEFAAVRPTSPSPAPVRGENCCRS
jgi:hypothetical protein